MIDFVTDILRELPEPLSQLSGFILIFFNLIALEYFLYLITQAIMQSFSPVRTILRKIAAPAIELGEEFQARKLQRCMIEGTKPLPDEYETDRMTFTVLKQSLRDVEQARIKLLLIVTVLLTVVHISFHGSLLSNLVLLYLATMIAIGIMTPLDFHEWEFTSFEEEIDIPLKYHLAFFVVLIISAISYQLNGTGDIFAFSAGLVFSIIYYNLTRLVCTVTSDIDKVTQVTVKLPPGRTFDHKYLENENIRGGLRE